MSRIVHIGTALPPFRHNQRDILTYMLEAFQAGEEDKRRIRILYDRSGIDYRYSVLPDFSLSPSTATFFTTRVPTGSFPGLDKRLDLFENLAPGLSARAIKNCINGFISPEQITHLITVSCTGLSAPGLEIRLIKEMGLPLTLQRTSVNFMGCYGAIHALKLGDLICKADPQARVVLVCTELCTLHFQNKLSTENIMSSLLFGDGAASVLICGESGPWDGISIRGFYSEVSLGGWDQMAWKISDQGFLMNLGSQVPQQLATAMGPLLARALKSLELERNQISHWAIHPGGKRILAMLEREMNLKEEDLEFSYQILRNFGNISSPSILFVLQSMMDQGILLEGENIFGAAFGPGLTLESMILQNGSYG